MKNFSFVILFLSCFISSFSHAAEQNSPFDSTLKFNPHTQLGFEVAQREGIKGRGTIAVIDNGIYAPHPALEHVTWVNCTNAGGDQLLYEYFQKQLESNSQNADVHPLMVSGVIACRPLAEGIPGIDYNIGLAHEANVAVYLTGVYYDESFQGLSNNQLGIKIRNTECSNWIKAFTKIKASEARVIYVSNAIPYDVQFEFHFLKKENKGLPYIRKDVMLAIQNCLSDEGNERLLVISASNTGQTIGEYDGTWKSLWGFKHLEELTNDPIISKRLIIVGNSSLGLTGHRVWDQGHPQFINNLKDYYEALKAYFSADNLGISFEHFIQDSPLFQSIRKGELERLVNEQWRLQLSLCPQLQAFPELFEQSINSLKMQIENQYPRYINREGINQQIKNLEHQFKISCKLYPVENDDHIALYPTSGKAGMAQDIFLSTIGTTILTATVPHTSIDFPGGSLGIYGRSFGTSFSTPIVGAAINLLLQVNPHLSVEEAKKILFTTADKPTQFPEIHGQGVMNFLKAYEQAKAGNF